ncbi:hypothetical protein [Winogradskyella sp. PE311]|uniref:hypothetical protein n=1 Tax=Winogradskyella sp. PE311 TaxID=3366943 RepID=UPI00398173E8
MKNQFKILTLMLITSAMSYGQRHQVLKKSVEVDKNTSVVLNFQNIYLAIEESTDGKIHFDYAMEFEGYSKKNIQKKLDELVAEVSSSDNHVTLTAKSINQITFSYFELKSDHGLYIEGDFFDMKKDSVIRKSKDSLLSQIRKNNRKKWSKNPLEYINGRFKKIDKDGNLSNIRKGNVDIMRSQFVIKVPPFVKLNINAQNSGVHFRNDMQNELSISTKEGTLKTKALMNTYNVIRIDNANFEAEAISGGTYNFKNVKNGKIGSTQNVKIKSEFSKVEIGEIGKNTIITDFNSEYWFYNWADKFERFNLYSEYSKIHFWYPTLDFSLKVIGNNTKSFLGNDVVINMQPNDKGEKYTMMTNEPDNANDVSGNIYFDIIHGIIYSNDFMLTKVTGDREIEETTIKN